MVCHTGMDHGGTEASVAASLRVAVQVALPLQVHAEEIVNCSEPLADVGVVSVPTIAVKALRPRSRADRESEVPSSGTGGSITPHGSATQLSPIGVASMFEGVSQFTLPRTSTETLAVT